MAIGRIDERRHVHHEIIAALRFEPLALAVSHPDLATYLDFACRIAVDAGTAILPHFRSALAVDDKGRAGVYDPVTEADRAAETTIREAIMRERGLDAGDRVIVKQQGTAENGEIVCAVINGEATLKRFFKKDGVITLKAENEKYAPIVVSEGEFRIAGRIVGLLRKF